MLKSTHRSAVSAAAEHSLAAGWTEHTAPTGHRYYYNASTKQSTYTRPLLEEKDEPLRIDFNATQPDYELQASLLAQDQFRGNGAPVGDPRGQGHFTGGRSYQEHSRKRGHGGDRPKTRAAIPNCEPWMLVKTKFGRRFVHNAETKQSLWKFPQDVMMKVIEMDRMEWEAKKKNEEQPRQSEKTEEVEQTRQALSAEKQAPAPPPARDADDSDSYEEVEVTDDEVEDEADLSNKRPRLSPQAPNAPPGPVEFDEEDIAWQLAQMDADADDYNHAGAEEDEDEGLPLTDEDTNALFRSLLDDYHISPYTTFERVTEDNELIEDSRYVTLPNMHRRKEVFQDWSRDRVAELQELKVAQTAKKQDDPKVKYLRFLQRNATPKLYWPEFKRKYKKDTEMKDYNISDKDREKMYREYVQKIKASESDRRKDLLALLRGLQKGELRRRSSMDDLPDGILKDLRFYLVDEKKRDELVEGFISTLGE